jgi:parvulin-like peptidyl-prolyl isomerase
VKIAALLLLTAPALLAQTTIEEILVAVNSHIITRKSFQQALEQQHAELYRKFSGQELDAKLRDAREKTMQELIDAFVLLDVATEKELLAFIPSEAEFLEDLKKRTQMTSEYELERAIKSEMGLSLSEFLRQQRQSFVIESLLYQEVYRKVPIEEQEARLYYNEHQADYKQTARFRIRELIIHKREAYTAGASARETLTKIQEELKKGASFESLVKDFSDSPSRGTGGDLGWVETGLLIPAIENAALKLKPDEISDVVETDKDYILIQLISSEMEGVKPFDAVRGEIIQKLQEPKAANALQHYLQAQRTRANIRYMVPKEQIIKG